MDRLFKQVILFLLPLLLLLGPPISILFFSYEAHRSIKDIIKDNSKYIIGYYYRETNYHFLKLFDINYFPKRKILVLGSSRVNEFRDKMFTTSFYNAGFTVPNVRCFKSFMSRVSKDKYPDLLLINIDQFSYIQHQKKSESTEENEEVTNYNTKEELPSKISTYFKIYPDILLNKKKLNIFINSIHTNRYGLAGVLTGSGFRNDGSFYYCSAIQKLLKNDSTVFDYHFLHSFKRMENKYNDLFGYDDSISSGDIVILDSFLQFCYINKIKVIGFLPPFAHAVIKRMEESGNYNYLNLFDAKMSPIFSKYNFEYYNFTKYLRSSDDDSAMIDGDHTSEVINQRMLLSMLRDKSVLNEVCDTNKLKYALDNKINRYTVYSY